MPTSQDQDETDTGSVKAPIEEQIQNDLAGRLDELCARTLALAQRLKDAQQHIVSSKPGDVYNAVCAARDSMPSSYAALRSLSVALLEFNTRLAQAPLFLAAEGKLGMVGGSALDKHG